MKMAIISDVHAKKSHLESYNFLLSFMKDKRVLDSESIFFLGDIFDLMVGNHAEYIDQYSDFFNALANLLKKKKKVFFFEGNHDFHLRRLFDFFLEKYNLDPQLFTYLEGGFHLRVKGKNYYFSHGDDIEIGNYTYKFYKSIVRSWPLKMVADNLFSFSFMERLGFRISENSKKRNKNKYQKISLNKKIKEKYLKSVETFFSKSLPFEQFDYIICGHSHIKEHYYSKKGFCYLNNGFALKSKTFILIEDHCPKFERLI